MRRTLVLLLVCVISKSLIAQNYPLYNGYFLNPFIYNPAAAASEQLQVNAGYRRQWLEIPNAPTVFSLTANTLLNETRAGVGVRISSSSRGFLRSTELSLAYAYGVPLNSSSRLFFGLSGGVLSNSVNLSDITNVNDPALGTLSSSMVPSISFGMLYKNTNGINLGFNLPKMVNSQQLDTKYSFTFLDDLIVSASFSRWNPTPKFVKGKSTKSYGKKKQASSPPLEVFSLYRYSSFYGSLIEATAKYNFNKSIWLSATYRQNQGFVPGIGVNADNVSFSYFYEPGVGGDLPLKTHEVLLTLRLGKDKKFRDKAPVPPVSKVTPPKQPTQVAKVQPKTTTPPAQTQVKKDVATQPVKKEEPVKKEVVTEPVKKETTQQVAAKTNVTPVKKDSAKTVAKVEVPTKDPEAAKHHPRFNQSLSQLDLGKKDTVAEAHEAERKELDKHIDDHAEGKHDDTHDVPVNQRHDFVKRGTHHEELELATYVIAGAFQSRGNAEHYVNTLKKLGYNTADFGHLSARNLWYVFIAEEPEIPEAKKDRDRLQKNKIFSTVWLLTVQQ